jgi:hypothetical protein
MAPKHKLNDAAYSNLDRSQLAVERSNVAISIKNWEIKKVMDLLTHPH